MLLTDAQKAKLISRFGTKGGAVSNSGHGFDIAGVTVWDAQLTNGGGMTNTVYAVRDTDKTYEYFDDFDAAMDVVKTAADEELLLAKRREKNLKLRLASAKEPPRDTAVRLFAMLLIAAIGGLTGWLVNRGDIKLAYNDFGGWLLALCLVCALSLLFEKHLSRAVKALTGYDGQPSE